MAAVVTQHPTEVSAVILLGLALLLSPYLLAGEAAAFCFPVELPPPSFGSS